jgi:7-carboxy-7-deazaguanine synthase
LAQRCHVYLSPIFGSITAARIVDFMKENRMNGVRVQLQLHKYIWDPELRGV